MMCILVTQDLPSNQQQFLIHLLFADRSLSTLLGYHHALHILLVANKQFAVSKCYGSPVFALLQHLGAGQRLETGRVRVYKIQHLVTVDAQQQTVGED